METDDRSMTPWHSTREVLGAMSFGAITGVGAGVVLGVILFYTDLSSFASFFEVAPPAIQYDIDGKRITPTLAIDSDPIQLTSGRWSFR